MSERSSDAERPARCRELVHARHEPSSNIWTRQILRQSEGASMPMLLSIAFLILGLGNGHALSSSLQPGNAPTVKCGLSDDQGCKPTTVSLINGPDTLYSRQLDFTPSDSFVFADTSVLLFGYLRGMSGASVQCPNASGDDLVVVLLDPSGSVAWRQTHRRNSITTGGTPYPLFVDVCDLKEQNQIAIAVQQDFPNRDQVWLLDRTTGEVRQRLPIPARPDGSTLGGCKVIVAEGKVSRLVCSWFDVTIKKSRIESIHCRVTVSDTTGMKLHEASAQLPPDVHGRWSRPVSRSVLTIDSQTKACAGVAVNVMDKQVLWAE